MPNIKPVSDLRNYNEVLRDISAGEPVYLTKNGRGKYAIIDLQDYEKMQSTIKLMAALTKGDQSGKNYAENPLHLITDEIQGVCKAKGTVLFASRPHLCRRYACHIEF